MKRRREEKPPTIPKRFKKKNPGDTKSKASSSTDGPRGKKDNQFGGRSEGGKKRDNKKGFAGQKLKSKKKVSFS